MSSNRIVPYSTGSVSLEPIELQAGHVLWLPLPQTLSGTGGVEEKTRPFVVCEPTTIHRFNNGICKPISLTGVCGTSQSFLVDGRPHVSFSVGRSGKTTYASADLVRTIYCEGMRIEEPGYKLTQSDVEILQRGLDQVLRPERKFSWPDGKFVPGQLWKINTAGFSGTAMILLRRGRFVPDEEIAYQGRSSTTTSYAPFLAVAFRQAEKITTLRGIGWNQVEIVPIHHATLMSGERCFQPSELSEQSAVAVLNILRRKMGLTTIDSNTKMRSANNILSWFLYIRRFGL